MVRGRGGHAGADGLARAISDALRERHRRPPAIVTLESLCHTVVAASLATEEQRNSRIQVAWVDPDRPDADPPRMIRRDRWQWVPFASPIPLSPASLVKLAAASDARSTSIGVHGKGRDLAIYGLIDQQNVVHNFLNREDDRAYSPPGAFYLRVEGLAHIRAYISLRKVAELRINSLVGAAVDVLDRGPIADALRPAIAAHRDAVWRVLTDLPALADLPAYVRRGWDEPLRAAWIGAFCRTLLRVENYRHGGGIVVTDDQSGHGLNVKYPLAYGRLSQALVEAAQHRIAMTECYELINEMYLSKDRDEMPVIDWLDYEVERDSLEDSVRELDGTTRFLSLLTQVDGALVLSRSLDVTGFGAEITFDAPPGNLIVARDPGATTRKSHPGDYNHYGTRHRSMMRYCWAVPGALGFVVSSDGGVRAITRREDTLIMWQDVQLQHEWEYRPMSASLRARA